MNDIKKVNMNKRLKFRHCAMFLFIDGSLKIYESRLWAPHHHSSLCPNPHSALIPHLIPDTPTLHFPLKIGRRKTLICYPKRAV